MTTKEALQAQFLYPITSNSIDLVLLNGGMDAAATYSPAEHKQGIEVALAGLIFIAITSPKSVSDMDYTLTAGDISDMLKLRSLILKRYDLPDEFSLSGSVIQDATNRW